MTDRITEIEARLNAATPGPWNQYSHSTDVVDLDGRFISTRGATGEFIAHSPSDVAYLLTELRKRDEALERVTEVLDNWQAEVPFQDAEETQRWYSLGKRHAAERIRAEIKGDGA